MAADLIWPLQLFVMMRLTCSKLVHPLKATVTSKHIKVVSAVYWLVTGQHSKQLTTALNWKETHPFEDFRVLAALVWCKGLICVHVLYIAPDIQQTHRYSSALQTVLMCSVFPFAILATLLLK